MDTKVTGQLSVGIYVDCPHCREWSIDLFDIDFLNDEGQLWSIIRHDRDVNGKNMWHDINMEFNCPKCDKIIIFDRLEY